MYEDVETGIKITIYRNEINGKITRNNLDKIARKKIEKEILKKNGLYEEIEVKLDKTIIEDLLEMDDNLVFTSEEVAEIENKIEEILKDENIGKYKDLEEYTFDFFLDGYTTKNGLIDFLKSCCWYENLMESSYFIEVEEEELKEREEMYLCASNDFSVEEFTHREQVEQRLNDVKPLTLLVTKYLLQLESRAIGERKTDEEMDREYGEYDWFRMERFPSHDIENSEIGTANQNIYQDNASFPQYNP